MSEGVRKVWNREQLLELNTGTILLITEGCNEPTPMQFNWRVSEITGTHYRLYEFGDSYPARFGTRMEPSWEPTEYPIDVIWEPTE